MTIREMQAEAHATAREKGWYDPPKTITEALCLMHSELSEALEEIRSGPGAYITYFKDNDKPDGFGVELADCVIRIMDLCEYLHIDLEECLKLKMAYNKTRPFRHGGKAV